ncbi:hypothetical protein GCM10020331_074820 [Ectobacillus funiculus]
MEAADFWQVQPLHGFSNAYMWIIVGRVLQGAGAAGTAPIAMALTGDLFKGGEQSRVFRLS